MKQVLVNLQNNASSDQYLNELRKLAVQNPIQDEYRSLAWKLLLRVKKIDVSRYITNIEKQKSSRYEKIIKDTKRTLATDNFQRVVKEDQLIRVLNALQHDGIDYVQGINVLVAPLLYNMSEPEAFSSSLELLKQTQTYYSPNLIGVHAACALVDKVLEKEDEQLRNYLQNKKITPLLIAFSRLMSFYASQPPLEAVLRLWDFYMAAGFQMNVVTVVAELKINRDLILNSDSPTDVLQNMQLSDVEILIQESVRIYQGLDYKLKQLIGMHCFDFECCKKLVNKMFGGYL
ncbi:Rab-GTPase-TBC domain-containing protein [Spironucleus salmonicida]|uniref:TBC domain-containing protein n=1 Tax=Spironucleus salmonicida TaxID=348837 RepID=V6LDY2_9EUKA|nr:Rab-GTPase-TBC domain-containing protein [Spironucleus salmonicida]|eukprot:EST42672.1 TBC domain-containing protein [Spironucleus salmonicida]